jgi:hypothetical protein
MMPDTKTFLKTGVLCAASSMMVAILASPAAAGNGAVSYENQLKVEQKKAREREPDQAAPAAHAPASSAPVATPAGAATIAPAPMSGADRDHQFATTARRQLADSASAAEEQAAIGKDPQLSGIAKRVAESQRKQIAELDKWLAAHPGRAAAK